MNGKDDNKRKENQREHIKRADTEESEVSSVKSEIAGFNVGEVRRAMILSEIFSRPVSKRRK